MNCYLCQIQSGNTLRPALAVCQYCGVGVCEEHLIEMRAAQTAGMAGNGGKTASVICCRCYTAAVSKRRPLARRPAKTRYEWKGAWWWGWFRRQPISDLPTPEEAVAAVEQFLHHKYN